MKITNKVVCATVFFALSFTPVCGRTLNSLGELSEHLKLRGATQKRMERIEFDQSDSGEWKNPTIELGHQSKAPKVEPQSEFSIGLGQPIELGSKMRTRHEMRQAQSAGLKLETRSLLQEQVYQVIYHAQAIKQKEQLDHTYEEAISSFQLIVRRLNKLPSLSFEKMIEKEALEFAIEDYKLKHFELEAQLSEHRAKLLNLLGEGQRISDDLGLELNQMASERINSHADVTQSLTFKALEASLELQRASLNLERANAWPDMEIGANVAFLKEAGQSDQRFGVSVSFELPVWNRNARQIGAARSELGYLEKNRELVHSKLQIDLKLAVDRLNSLKKVLAQSGRGKSIEAKHRKAEKLFEKGVVSTGLIIELHRQLIELTSSQSQAQLEYIEVLWRVLSLSGTIEI